jgi:hypothetical protein
MRDSGERRLSWRYKVGLGIQVRVADGRTVSKWRAGKTYDISTRGILFRCAQPVPVNARVEMIIDWPARHDDRYPIFLLASGDVVRIRGKKIAVRITFCRMVIEKAHPKPIVVSPLAAAAGAVTSAQPVQGLTTPRRTA